MSTVYHSPDGTPDEDALMVVRNAREAQLQANRVSFLDQKYPGKSVPAYPTPDGSNVPPPGWTAQQAITQTQYYLAPAPEAEAKSESAEAEVAESKPSGNSKSKTTRSAGRKGEDK